MKKSLVVLIVPTILLIYVTLQASKSIILSTGYRNTFVQHGNAPSGEEKAGSKVILMTYGRSGSSFTSEIIQKDTRVFYTFEPLYNLIRRFIGQDRGVNQVQTNGTKHPAIKYKIYPNDTADQQEYDKQSIEILDAFLTCQFEALRINDISNYQLRNSEDSRKLWSCVQPNLDQKGKEAIECFLTARQVCLQRPVRMVKTIRLRGVAALQLMAKHPDLRLLYLVRDPRGTITSQRRVFHNFMWEMVGNFSEVFCQTIREDLAAVRQMFASYGSSRVKIIRYERLAHSPFNASQEVFAYLNLNYTDSVRQFIFNRTMAGESKRNPYATTKKNSTEAANSWRSKITLSDAQIIDSNCMDIYEMLGYIPLTSQSELTDMSRSLWRKAEYEGNVF